MAKMGRKPRDGVTRETLVTFKLSEDEVKRLNEMAEYIEAPKSVFARNMLLDGLKEMEYLKKVGALKTAKGILKTSEFLKELTSIKKNHIASFFGFKLFKN